MILNSSRSLQIVLAGAVTTNQLPVIVDYEDETGVSIVKDSFVSATNSTTAATIAVAPTGSTKRNILVIQVYNRDTAAATVQISVVTGATSAQLTDVTLQVDDVLTYTNTGAWKVTDVNGNIKQNTSTGTNLVSVSATTVTASTSLYARGLAINAQPTPSAKTVSATLTAAELLTKIITVAQGAGAASAQQLPLATAMDTALPDFIANDSFDFSVINISTVAAETASVTTNTGWTLVGNMLLAANTAVTDNSQGRFRARKTGTGAWVLYRIS